MSVICFKEDDATIATYQYDGASKLTSKAFGIINQSYTYNQQGAVNTATTTTRAELSRNTSEKSGRLYQQHQEAVSRRTRSFTYDKMGRLIAAVDNGRL